MDRLLLVDGSNLLFQMFYGMPARIVNSQGKAIQGTLGFVGALLKILRMTQPTHVAVLFDGECGGSRGALDPGYKADRPDYSQMPEEDTPFSQLPDIYAALDYLGIFHRETTDCEADDWMAAYAMGYGGQYAITIASQDSDLFQLIGDHVRILRYRGEKTVLWDRACLQEKLGVTPEQYGGYKALTGDNSDHIPGVRGVGPKTAAALMNQFGTLDALLAGVEQVQKPAIRQAIRDAMPRIRLNDLLIRLSGEVPPPADPQMLAFTDRGLTTTQILTALSLRP